MSESELVSLTLKDRLATIEISREKNLNALNQEVLSGLSSALGKIFQFCQGPRAYDECRLVLLRGSGPKAFVAGADIKEMAALEPHGVQSFTVLGQRVMREIESLPLPVIAVLQGFTFGGGLELALAADLIIASEKAVLGQPEVKLGLIPGFGGTQRLIRRVGIGQAKKIILTGDEISAAEGSRIGLVDYLAPAETLETQVESVCQSLLARSPLALAAAKRAIEKHVEGNTIAGLAFEQEEFIRSFGSQDAKEGLDAFLNKRTPTFSGHYE